MRKFFSRSSIVAGIFVLAAVLVLSNITSAQVAIQAPVQEAPQSTDANLQDQLTKLIESQNRLSEAMEKAFLSEEVNAEGGVAPAALLTGTAPRPRCAEDSSTWPSSNTYRQADWDLSITDPGTTAIKHNFYDVNGDGLIDYFFVEEAATRKQCLYLNNGSGWDRVFKCYMTYDGGTQTWTYRGDCAEV